MHSALRQFGYLVLSLSLGWAAIARGADQPSPTADAMLYLLYQHADGNVEANLTSGLTNVQINQFQQVIAGVRYAF